MLLIIESELAVTVTDRIPTRSDYFYTITQPTREITLVLNRGLTRLGVGEVGFDLQHGGPIRAYHRDPDGLPAV